MKNKELLAYMQGVSACIGTALKREGVGGYLIRAKRGPLTLSFSVGLHDPSMANIRKALGITPALQQLTRTKSIRVDQGEGGIDIEFPSPDPRSPSAEELVGFMKGANVAIGLDKWCNPLYLNLKNNPNILFVGPQGRGKSTAVKSLLYGIIKTTKTPMNFIIFSAKTEDWQVLSGVEGCLGLVSAPELIDQEMERLSDELNHLGSNPEKVTPTFIVIDDFQNLLGKCKTITQSMSTVVSMGRALKRYVFCLTQTVGSKDTSGGFKIEDLFDARVVYRTASKHSAARATGADAAAINDLTDEKGDAALVMGGKVLRMATPYISDKEIATLPKVKTVVTPVQIVPVDGPKPPTCPTIAPPRPMTQEETVELEMYIRHTYRKTGKYPSLRQLTIDVFGTKTPKTDKLLRQGLDPETIELVKGIFGGGLNNGKNNISGTDK